MPTTFVPTPASGQLLHIYLGTVCSIVNTNTGGTVTATSSAPFTFADIGNIIALVPLDNTHVAQWGTVTGVSSTTVAATTITGITSTGKFKAVIFRETPYLTGSVHVESDLTTRPTANFSIYNKSLSTTIQTGTPVLIIHDTYEDQFGGSVEQSEYVSTPGQPSNNRINLECVGWEQSLDKRLVAMTSQIGTRTDYFIGTGSKRTFDLNSIPTSKPTAVRRIAYGIRGASWGVVANVSTVTLTFSGSAPTLGQTIDVFGVAVSPGSGAGFDCVGVTVSAVGTDFLGRNTVQYEYQADPGVYINPASLPTAQVTNGYVAIYPGTTPDFELQGAVTYDWAYTLNSVQIAQNPTAFGTDPLGVFEVLAVTYTYAVQLDFYNQSPESIISTLAGIATTEGIRTNLITSGLMIQHIQFSTSDSMWSAIKAVCKYVSNGTTNYWAFIDSRLILNFAVQAITNAAPWNLTTSDLGNALIDVSAATTREKYANAAVVDSSTSLDPASVTETMISNGSAKSFNVSLPIGALISLVVQTYTPSAPPNPPFVSSSPPQSFGILGDPASPSGSEQWYWSVGSTTITQDVGPTALAANQRLVVTYQQIIKGLDQSINTTAIAVRAAIELGSGEYDVYENLTTGVPLLSSTSPAQQITDYFSVETSTVKISTFRGGLAPGQSISALMPDINVNGTYAVDKVVLTDEGGDCIWECSLVQGAVIGDWKTSFLELTGQVTSIDVGLTSGGTNTTTPMAENYAVVAVLVDPSATVVNSGVVTA